MRKRTGILSLLGLSFFAVTAAAQATTTGFEGGNDITITNLRGGVWLYCDVPGVGNSQQFFSCRGDDASPGRTARFVTETGSDADYVELTAVHADGTSATEKEKFEGATGRSKDSFNLLISTLFQHPLLAAGINQVHFKLLKGNVSRHEGDFQASVKVDPTVHACEVGSIFESNSSLCNDAFHACERYFEQEPRCQ